jgi:hypothetical protein
MLTMQIHRTCGRAESIEFQDLFSILSEMEDSRKLFWVVDREPRLGEGAFLIQVRRDASGSYEIDTVGTDWVLTLDDAVMAPGIYIGVDVSGKTMELEHEEYRFVCSFPSSERRESHLEALPPYKQFFPLLESGPVTMYIYQSGKEIEAREFWGQFYIVRNKEGELHWLADNDQAPPSGGGACIWIIGGGTAEREIKSVGPDWQLTINGVVMERGIYFDVYVSGKTVELEHGEYRFVCSFPPFGGGRVLRSEDAPPYVFIPVSEAK